jgi:hypothetical protein
MFKILIGFILGFIVFPLIVNIGDGRIRSVAPYAFYDFGDFIEIKGGWNYSETKYESTVIVCDKRLGVCADYTARLFQGHLHIAPILWEVQYWGGEAINPEAFLKEYSGVIIATSADMGGTYSNSALYIDRSNKEVFIISKTDRLQKDDWKDLLLVDDINLFPEGWEITERLQNTFYQRLKSRIRLWPR